MIVFLTDGLPTVGETNIDTILQHVKELNQGIPLRPSAAVTPTASRSTGRACSAPRRRRDMPLTNPVPVQARIFCFGLGYDVNVPFLDRLGAQEKGDSDFIKPEEDVEVKVSAFFSKVASPILSNVRLAFEGADVYDVYPNHLPDLFKGSQLVITGRFRGERAGTVRLTGTANDHQETFTTPAAFDRADGMNSFVPRLWAQRKIGYLVDQLRLCFRHRGAGQQRSD